MPVREAVIGVRVSKREKEMFDRVANGQGMTVSDYVRAGAMLMAVLDCDKEALKISAALIREKVSGRLRVDPDMLRSRKAVLV